MIKQIKIKIFIFLLFIITFSKEISEYSSSLLYNTIIGESQTQISLIINTYDSNNILFTNINRKYATEINFNRNGTTLNETIKLGKKTVKNLTFSLIMDQTELNNKKIQGEIGLGINADGQNSLMEHLYDIDLIRKKQILIETNNDPENINIVVDPEILKEQYYYCNLTDKLDLSEKRHEVWICEMSHLLAGFTKEELSWNNAEEIIARVVFDSRTKYIYIPEGYINLILDIWNLNLTLCPISEDIEREEKFINCSYLTEDELNNIKPIYFIMDGYACLFLASDLFEKVGYNQYFSIIRFRVEAHDIWTLGIPFFKKYKVLFDYEKKRVGFSGNGNSIINYNEQFIKWKKEKDAILNKKSNDKKIVVIGAFMGSIILIVMLFFLIRSFTNENSKMHSKFIEEIDRGYV